MQIAELMEKRLARSIPDSADPDLRLEVSLQEYFAAFLLHYNSITLDPSELSNAYLELLSPEMSRRSESFLGSDHIEQIKRNGRLDVRHTTLPLNTKSKRTSLVSRSILTKDDSTVRYQLTGPPRADSVCFPGAKIQNLDSFDSIQFTDLGETDKIWAAHDEDVFRSLLNQINLKFFNNLSTLRDAAHVSRYFLVDKQESLELFNEYILSNLGTKSPSKKSTPTPTPALDTLVDKMKSQSVLPGQSKGVIFLFNPILNPNQFVMMRLDFESKSKTFCYIVDHAEWSTKQKQLPRGFLKFVLSPFKQQWEARSREVQGELPSH